MTSDAQTPTRRPGLAAQRALQIVNLLAANPRHNFRLTEIMQATELNVSSCHALLRIMLDSGYIGAGAQPKTYTLGTALIGIGQAAWESQPLAQQARIVAENLSRSVGMPTLLTALHGDDIVSILSIGEEHSADAGFPSGRRVPMLPPMGAPFVAWGGETAIEAWMGKGGPVDTVIREGWRDALVLIRERGFQVTLRPKSPQLAALMRNIALGGEPRSVQEEWDRFFHSPDRTLLQPETIEEDGLYDISQIASPIFDKNRQVAFSLAINGFREAVRGKEIAQMSAKLMEACVKIMRGGA